MSPQTRSVRRARVFSITPREKLRLSAGDFSRARELSHREWPIVCRPRATRDFSPGEVRAISREFSRESARPPSIGSGTNKLTWQLNVSRRRARIIARVSQRVHCAWRKNRLRSASPGSDLACCTASEEGSRPRGPAPSKGWEVRDFCA